MYVDIYIYIYTPLLAACTRSRQPGTERSPFATRGTWHQRGAMKQALSLYIYIYRYRYRYRYSYMYK